MKLVWNKTGDYINCTPIDNNFVDQWLEQDQVWISNGLSILKNNIDELTALIVTVAPILDKFKLKLTELPITGKQSQLNEIHRNWVKLFQKYPNIHKLFDQQSYKKLERINKCLHELEESWHLFLKANNSCSIKNIPAYFGKANIVIPYENLGRSYYNKWINFDDSVTTSDTNNFKEIIPTIKINICRTYFQDPPKEYVDWCVNKNINVLPNTILLANFDNVDENLDRYRDLFIKNFVLNNNDVIFVR